MFTQTWRKYLPVIQILLKRSAQGDQSLQMNHTDFERAAAGRKIRYSFSNLELVKARMNNQSKQPPFAKEFATFLLEDENMKRFLMDKHVEFSMTNNFSLSIKQHVQIAAPETEAAVVAEDETDDAE
jgi:hypothetical protein